MGMLSKAKESKGEKPEEKKKKKHKHPSVQASQPVDDGPDAETADEGGGSDDAPAADADEQQAPNQPDGADAGAPDAQAQGGQADQDPSQGQQVQDGGSQGQAPMPVKNPQAPGAGDDASGGEDTPAPGDDATGAPGGTPSAEGGPGASTMQQVPMSPALKEEYQNLDRMLVQKLYHGGVAESILPSLLPQGPHKIKGVITMAVLLAREIFLKAKAPQQLTLPFARDCAAHVMQVAEQVKGIQYTDQECTAIIGGVYEGMLRAFGVKKSQFGHMQGIIPRSQFSHHARTYVAAHGHAKQAADANNAQVHAEHVDEAQPQGPAAQAGGPQAPQGGPPGGGMLQQAAAAQPQPGAQPEAGAA